MILRPHPFALASSLTTVITYTTASLFLKYFPTEVLQATAPLIQLNRMKLFRYLRPFFGFSHTNFIVALAELALYSYVSYFILAVLYNLICAYTPITEQKK